MKFDPKAEEQLKEIVLKILEHGRPNWDIPHTLAAVHWMKELLKKESGDERILIPAMYLHDIGYSQVDATFTDFKSTVSASADHMRNGVIIAEPILKLLNFSEEETKEILLLVEVHDKVELITTPNEILIFEADSLAQMDTDRAVSNFNEEDRKKFLESFRQKRLNNFRTKTGKKLIKNLCEKARKFYGID